MISARNVRRTALPLLVLLSCMVGAARATEMIVNLGDARVRYDDARWTATPSAASIRFEPQGEVMRRVDPVELQMVDEAGDCDALAARAFALGPYDESEITRQATRIGGIDGVRLSAHTRCRNATPRGVAACVRFEGRAYLLSAVLPGCRGRNLFTGIDPLSELVAGISFLPIGPQK